MPLGNGPYWPRPGLSSEEERDALLSLLRREVQSQIQRVATELRIDRQRLTRSPAEVAEFFELTPNDTVQTAIEKVAQVVLNLAIGDSTDNDEVLELETRLENLEKDFDELRERLEADGLRTRSEGGD
jgi:hypothetical protein